MWSHWGSCSRYIIPSCLFLCSWAHNPLSAVKVVERPKYWAAAIQGEFLDIDGKPLLWRTQSASKTHASGPASTFLGAPSMTAPPWFYFSELFYLSPSWSTGLHPGDKHWNWRFWDVMFLINLVLIAQSCNILHCHCGKTGDCCIVPRICICLSWWASLVYTDLLAHFLFGFSSFLDNTHVRKVKWVVQPLKAQWHSVETIFINIVAEFHCKSRLPHSHVWCHHKRLDWIATPQVR